MEKFTDQLWIVRGTTPALFTAPVRVSEVTRREVECYLAMPLSEYHERAVRSLMLDHCRPFNGMWRTTLAELKRFSAPAPPEFSPEECFSWQRKPFKPTTHLQEATSPDIEDFISYLYQSGLGRSREEIAYWWAHFCNAAFDWLINQERPLDLHFVRLWNSPLREGWIERTIRKRKEFFSKTALSRNTRRVDLLTEALTQPGIIDFLRNAAQMNPGPGGTINRTFEAEPTRRWHSAVKRVEEKRLAMLQREGYAECCQHSLDRFTKTAIRLLAQRFLSYRRAPLALVKGRMAGTSGLKTRRLFIYPEGDRRGNLHYRYALFGGYPPEDTHKRALKKARQVSVLPPIQSSL